MFQISLLKFSDFAQFSFAVCIMLTIPAHLTVLRQVKLLINKPDHKIHISVYFTIAQVMQVSNVV